MCQNIYVVGYLDQILVAFCLGFEDCGGRDGLPLLSRPSEQGSHIHVLGVEVVPHSFAPKVPLYLAVVTRQVIFGVFGIEGTFTCFGQPL